MYNIKGPSKIVANTTTRRGITQKLDNFRDHNKNKISDTEQIGTANVPKPVFQKKSSPTNQRHKNISPQHEEIINYIYDSWNSVYAELILDNEDIDDNGSGSKHAILYRDDGPGDLRDFKPFDLESWWGKRLYAYITSSEYKN